MSASQSFRTSHPSLSSNGDNPTRSTPVILLEQVIEQRYERTGSSLHVDWPPTPSPPSALDLNPLLLPPVRVRPVQPTSPRPLSWQEPDPREDLLRRVRQAGLCAGGLIAGVAALAGAVAIGI